MKLVLTVYHDCKRNRMFFAENCNFHGNLRPAEDWDGDVSNCIMGLFGWRILIPLQRNSVLRQNQSCLTSNLKMTNNILSYSLNNQDPNDIEEVRIQLESSNTDTCSELSNKSFLSSKNRHFEVEAGRTTFMRKGVTFANKQKKRKTKQKNKN